MTVEMKSLDHVNVRTANLEGMVAWYGKMLGMRSGPRPDFPFPGAWLYRDGQALVHLVGVGEAPADADDLKMEHVAFAATGLSEFRARLTRLGVPFREGRLDDFGIVQVNVWDADGNHLHIDFDAGESD